MLNYKIAHYVKETEKLLKKILVVDDDDISRDLLAEILELEYEIIPAKNGAEALGLLSFQLGTVEAVLLDLMMPQMNGYEFLEQFNAKGWNDKVPVVIVSSSDDEETREKCHELGVNHFVSKPYTHKEATSVIADAIENFSKGKKSRKKR